MPVLPPFPDNSEGVPSTVLRDPARGENRWELVQVVAFDGLMPTQVVRRISKAEGLDKQELTRLVERFDTAADSAKQGGTAAGRGATGTDRYVANPWVGGKYNFDGLWTGGPVMGQVDGGGRVVELRQTLTRTFCAGHGYTTDGSTGAVTISKSPSSTAFATVEDALKKHRPALQRIFASRLAFDGTIPGAYRTEITWRDFTHESIPYLENEETGRAAALAAAKHHFGEDFIKTISAVHCNVDPQTNTVVAVASAVYAKTSAPETLEALLEGPVVQSPCQKRTMREFGWGAGNGGEGVLETHTFRFVNIEDSAKVRAFLDLPLCDKDLLPRLMPEAYRADSPVLSSDGQRYEYSPAGASSGKRPWYRVLTQQIEKDESEDRGGLLSFVVTVARATWSGTDTNERRILAGVENSGGYGESQTRVVPSVPRENAQSTLENALGSSVGSDGTFVTAGSQSEGESGYSDIRLQTRRAFSYSGTSKPTEAKVDSTSMGSSLTHTKSVTREGWEARFESLDISQADKLAGDAAKTLLGKITNGDGQVSVKSVQTNPDGRTCTLTLRVDGASQNDFGKWVAQVTAFATTEESLRYGVGKDKLSTGGLNTTTGAITRVSRSLDETSGLWNEQTTVTTPKTELTLEWYAKTRQHGLGRKHVIFRNAKSVPTELSDPANSRYGGSVAKNEHGFYDGQWEEVDNGDEVQKTAAEDAFSKQSSVRTNTESSDLDKAGLGSDGTITSVQETAHDDGTFTTAVTTETPKVVTDTFVTVDGDGHHRRETTHTVYRNATEKAKALANPAGGSQRVSGSDQTNRHGLHDGQVSIWDVEGQDDTAKTKSENYFVKDETETTTASGASHLELVQGPQVTPGQSVSKSVEEVTYPDGYVRSTVHTRTAKKQEDPVIYSIDGDEHHRRVVEHHRIVNGSLDDVPDKLKDTPNNDETKDTERINGSVRYNADGMLDIEWTRYDAKDNPKPDNNETFTKDFYGSTTLLKTQHKASGEPPEDFADNKYTEQIDDGTDTLHRFRQVTYPDGASDFSEEKIKATYRSGSYSWMEARNIAGTDFEWRCTCYWWRNSPESDPRGLFQRIADAQTEISVQETRNQFGLYDGTLVTRPNWQRISEINSTSYYKNRKISKKQTRAYMTSAGEIKEESRTITSIKEVNVVYGTPTAAQIAEAYAENNVQLFSAFGYWVKIKTSVEVNKWPSEDAKNVVWYGPVTNEGEES